MKERKSDKKRVEKVAKPAKVKEIKAKKAPKTKKPTDKLADKTATTKVLQHIFGDAQKKTLHRLKKRVVEINKLGPKYAKMDKKELAAQTEKLKARFDKLNKQAQAEKAVEKVKGKDAKKADKKAPKKIDKKARIAADNKVLDQILPEAFALVREASDRILKLRPFDVQLIGGIVLHEGNVAEMKTGEGKTLVATLPAYLNALTGRGVHIVTVNDYLAQRDAGWMGELYDFLGLSVGVIINEASFRYNKSYENEDHDDPRMRRKIGNAKSTARARPLPAPHKPEPFHAHPQRPPRRQRPPLPPPCPKEPSPPRGCGWCRKRKSPHRRPPTAPVPATSAPTSPSPRDGRPPVPDRRKRLRHAPPRDERRTRHGPAPI